MKGDKEREDKKAYIIWHLENVGEIVWSITLYSTLLTKRNQLNKRWKYNGILKIWNRGTETKMNIKMYKWQIVTEWYFYRQCSYHINKQKVTVTAATNLASNMVTFKKWKVADIERQARIIVDGLAQIITVIIFLTLPLLWWGQMDCWSASRVATDLEAVCLVQHRISAIVLASTFELVVRLNVWSDSDHCSGNHDLEPEVLVIRFCCS